MTYDDCHVSVRCHLQMTNKEPLLSTCKIYSYWAVCPSFNEQYLHTGSFPCKAISKVIQLPSKQGWVYSLLDSTVSVHALMLRQVCLLVVSLTQRASPWLTPSVWLIFKPSIDVHMFLSTVMIFLLLLKSLAYFYHTVLLISFSFSVLFFFKIFRNGWFGKFW